MRRQLAIFAVAGVVGFAVDAAVLYGTLACGLGPLEGRAVSFPCAVATTWLINRTHAFTPPEGRSLLAEFAHYLAAMSAGAVVNYGVYSLVVWQAPRTSWTPLMAIALGVVAGMSLNFVGAKWWVFKRR